MRNPLKTTLASLMTLALLPMAASAAYTVCAPHPGNVTATTYYSSGAFHGAVDIASGDTCGVRLVRTAVKGLLSWNVTVRTTTKACYGNGSGNQNEVKHTFANGYTFRQWHFLYDADLSKDQTCDRCAIGREGGTGNVTGPHTHLQYDKSGTNSTSWYAGTVKGEFLDLDEVIGTVG
ncbi:hypothetical protein D187_000096 [Cystobacter fuscus DSM 2262]|uniref:Peptidase M23 domain-containing protein n=1 Tax=Cystobacter fuscus (strain ATCC 25194 / DSM 2262 / NBRC 100088 / M29) TaxID=1242864 RepID=S9QTQ8_CYSF2|nr:hypothetical protein [Cystobacter fuscus]EPX64674.1 hypothetical protein D187_000096 [Cystobacter fuscus DSM 2262]